MRAERESDVVLIPVTVKGDQASWDSAERIVREIIGRHKKQAELESPETLEVVDARRDFRRE